MKLKASEEYEVVDVDDVSEETAEPEADDWWAAHNGRSYMPVTSLRVTGI